MEHNAISKIYRQEDLGPLTFGFDIGVASVGWAILSEKHIVDLGVRCFPAAEDPKEKISLNQARRAARTGRNRNAQRKSRLNRLEQLFADVGLMPLSEVKALFAGHQAPGITTKDIWELRSQALTRPLDAPELARVLHHLVKWRGYGSLRDAKDRFENEEKDLKQSISEPIAAPELEKPPTATNSTKKQAMPFSKALDKTEGLVEKLLAKYQTVGNLVHQLSKATPHNLGTPEEREAAALYQKAKHNHADGYERSQLRRHLRLEMQTIFERQRKLGNSICACDVPEGKQALEKVVIGSISAVIARNFESQALALFDEQHPPIVGAHMEQLVGKCALEPLEYRAPKWSFSAERSHWLQTLNKLKVRVAGDAESERFLTNHERLALVNLPYEKTDVSYADLRDALCESASWPKDWRLANFAPLRYVSTSTPQSDQIKMILPSGETIKLLDAAVAHLPKTDKKGKKKTTDEFKEWLTVEAQKQALTFAGIRKKLNIDESSRFSMLRKVELTILPGAEASVNIPLSSDGEEPLKTGYFLKIRVPSEKADQKLSAQAMSNLRNWCRSTQPRTLGDLRNSLPNEYWPQGNWQFVLIEKNLIEPSMEQEKDTFISLSFSDAQAIEKDRFVRLQGWHKLKAALSNAPSVHWSDLEAAWRLPNSEEGIKAANHIDEIFIALTMNFTDLQIEDALKDISPEIPQDARRALLTIVSSGFAHLSYLALRTIRPQLEMGHVYSKACELSEKGYDHSGSHARRKAQKYLPKLDTFLFRRISVKTNDVKKRPLRGGAFADVVEKRFKGLANPVVARSFNQARNVLNALIQTYGSPAYVSIELARDMSKPGSVRKDIEKENKARVKQKDQDRETFTASFKISDPSAQLMRKVRMRNEQDCKCMYSGKDIDLDRLLDDDKYVEIDHILPRSRTADNSLDNQVLVLAGENQRKGNRTPYEWKAKADPNWWHTFRVTVQNLPLMSDRKKQKLLIEKLDESEFTAANLVDTRYVTRLFARTIREGLIFHGGNLAKEETISPDDNGQIKLNRFMRARVRTPQGGVTSMLRGLWGLSKNRAAGDLHHALDACVVAAATPKLIQRLNEFNKFKESVIISSNGMPMWRESNERALGEILTPEELQQFVEKEFPQPFQPVMFHQEVMARLSHNGTTYLTKHGEPRHFDFANYTAEARSLIRPVTVSRLVQRNRRNNELHDEQPKALRRVQILLTELSTELLNPDRYPKQFSLQNRERFAALKKQLEQHEGDPQAAFVEGFLEFGKTIEAIPIPWLFLTEEEQRAYSRNRCVSTKSVKGSFKQLPLTKLTLDDLTEENLGGDIWNREQLLIQALREQLSKPNAKAAEIFANGFPKPESASGKAKRLQQGIKDFKPPIVKSIRVPAQANSGFAMRGGLVGQGAPISVLVVKNLKNNQIEFIPRYAAKKVHAIGLPDQKPNSDQRELFALLQNSYVEIKHPNLIYCFVETGRRHDGEGNILVDVRPLFPDGVFRGYYSHYNPSQERPVLFTHDNSPFFLLADDKSVDLKPLTVIERVKSNTRKNAVKGQANDTKEFVLLDDLKLEKDKPRTFAVVTEISRKISDAKHFQLIRIDNLGRIQN